MSASSDGSPMHLHSNQPQAFNFSPALLNALLALAPSPPSLPPHPRPPPLLLLLIHLHPLPHCTRQTSSHCGRRPGRDRTQVSLILSLIAAYFGLHRYAPDTANRKNKIVHNLSRPNCFHNLSSSPSQVPGGQRGVGCMLATIAGAWSVLLTYSSKGTTSIKEKNYFKRAESSSK